MNLTVNKTKEKISGMVGFNAYAIPFDATVYQTLLEIEEDIYTASTPSDVQVLIEVANEVIAAATVKRHVNSYISENVKFVDGLYYLIAPNGVVSVVPIPEELVERMISAKHEDLTVEPYLKAWTWFLRNEQFSLAKAKLFGRYINAKYSDKKIYNELIAQGYTEAKAKEFSTYDEVSITKSGLLSTYKYVDYQGSNHEKAVDRYEETPTSHAEDCIFLPPVMGRSGELVLVDGVPQHEVVIGRIHELPSWNSVNCNDSQSCVKGLHVGSQTYINGYGGRTSFLLNCLVSPSDIGAFVQGHGADSGALRVLRYFPVSVNTAPNKGRYHESTLLDKVESEWQKERQRAIDDTNAKIAKLLGIQTQLKSF